MSVLEAERIYAILEDTTEKLSFLDSITPDILQHRDELSKFIGEEISRTMNEQTDLEKRYERLIEQRSAMKGMVNKSKYKAVQEEIQDVSRALRESTNNLVRSLKENPNVSGNMIKVQRDRGDLYDLLLRCSHELRDKRTFHTIIHKVDEENASRLRLNQLRTREKSLREVVVKLKLQLEQEQADFKRIAGEQRKAISVLKDELQDRKGSTSTDARFRRKESLASVSAIWREFKLKERVLETKLRNLEDKLQTENIVNSETKEFLNRKHAQLADELAQWEAKYDRDVGNLDNVIRKVTTDRADILEKLSALQLRKQMEEAQEKDRNEALAMEEDLAKKRAALLKRQNKASRRIVRELRQYIKRKKELEAIKGEGKKKKGADKKGKKGKK